MPSNRLIVCCCGGRDFDDYGMVERVMHSMHSDGLFSMVVQGGARGADSLVRLWCNSHSVTCITEHADWMAHGRAAGPIRNQKMIDDYHPSLLIAFPGGRGTSDMVSRCKKSEIQVVFACDYAA